jgi:hypothetical protein
VSEPPSHPPGATLQLDVTPASWIVGRLWPWNADVGTRVGAVVPEGFDVYVRAFHPAGGARWSEVAEATGRTFHPLAQFTRLAGEVWEGEPPREGCIDRPGAEALVGRLRQHTRTSDDCWLAIWHGYGGITGRMLTTGWTRAGEGWLARLRRRLRRPPMHPVPLPPGLDTAPTFGTQGREYYLYRGTIDVVPRFDWGPSFQTPNLWWPDDRAWCVATEIDFDSTLVGCSRECAGALLASSELETAEVELEDRLDVDGDTINPPRPPTVPS